MNFSAKIFWMLAAVTLSGSLAATESRGAGGSFDVTNMVLGFRTTPIQKYENASNTSRVSSKTRWFVLHSTFVPSPRSSGEQWYDDITMEGTAVIVRNTGKKNTEYVVLTGKTRFFTIPADGKQHPGIFYISPKILDRYCGWADPKSVRAAKVAFYGNGRVLLGSGILAADGKRMKMLVPGSNAWKDAEAMIKKFDRNYSNVIVLRGGLYSKEKTPWVHFRYDFYDLIYDNIIQSESEEIKR